MMNDIKLLEEVFSELGIEFGENEPVDSFTVIGADGKTITIDENFNIFSKIPEIEFDDENVTNTETVFPYSTKKMSENIPEVSFDVVGNTNIETVKCLGNHNFYSVDYNNKSTKLKVEYYVVSEKKTAVTSIKNKNIAA